jgi:hypothetical protein
LSTVRCSVFSCPKHSVCARYCWDSYKWTILGRRKHVRGVNCWHSCRTRMHFLLPNMVHLYPTSATLQAMVRPGSISLRSRRLWTWRNSSSSCWLNPCQLHSGFASPAHGHGHAHVSMPTCTQLSHTHAHTHARTHTRNRCIV